MAVFESLRLEVYKICCNACAVVAWLAKAASMYVNGDFSDKVLCGGMIGDVEQVFVLERFEGDSDFTSMIADIKNSPLLEPSQPFMTAHSVGYIFRSKTTSDNLHCRHFFLPPVGMSLI